VASGDGADPLSQGAQLRLVACALPMQQTGDQRPGGRLVADLLGSQMLGREQRSQGLVVAAGLAVPAATSTKYCARRSTTGSCTGWTAMACWRAAPPSPRATAAETRWTRTLVGPKAVKAWLASAPSRRAVLPASFNNARLVIGSPW
jgi:hypothetical protein